MNLSDLRTPFAVKDIEVRAGQTNGDKTKAMALAYVTSRAIMDRLDEVVGPENWADMYTAAPVGGVLCGISIRVGDDWVTKWDGADNTNFEAVKGGLSGSFKRAGVKWGIGRYLYDVPAVWVSCQVRGKTVVIDENEAKAKMFGKQQSHQPPTAPVAQAPVALAPQRRQIEIIDDGRHNNVSPAIISKPAPKSNANGKQTADPWPTKSGPVFDFCSVVREMTGDAYTSQYHLSNAIGGFGNLGKQTEFEDKLAKAVDRAASKQAPAATQPAMDELAAAFPRNTAYND